MKNNINHEKQRLQNAIYDQRKWIEDCENNGESYKGEQGHIIRKADLSALSNLEKRLAKMTEEEE